MKTLGKDYDKENTQEGSREVEKLESKKEKKFGELWNTFNRKERNTMNKRWSYIWGSSIYDEVSVSGM